MFRIQDKNILFAFSLAAIYTAAVQMICADNKEIIRECRTPEIMADAAYTILTKDCKSYTGNFAIDDDILRSSGITDLAKYSCVPGIKIDSTFEHFLVCMM